MNFVLFHLLKSKLKSKNDAWNQQQTCFRQCKLNVKLFGDRSTVYSWNQAFSFIFHLKILINFFRFQFSLQVSLGYLVIYYLSHRNFFKKATASSFPLPLSICSRAKLFDFHLHPGPVLLVNNVFFILSISTFFFSIKRKVTIIQFMCVSDSIISVTYTRISIYIFTRDFLNFYLFNFVVVQL